MSDASPDGLNVLRMFVNTREIDGNDPLDSPDRLRDWLAAHGLLDAATLLSDEDVVKAVEFRDAIRALVVARAEGRTDHDAIACLNRVGADVRLSVAIDSGGRALIDAACTGLDEALGRLYTTLYTAMVDGSFERLKACSSDACLWLFFDRSKNRSKKWCDMQTCGNAANAKAYRKRLKETDD